VVAVFVVVGVGVVVVVAVRVLSSPQIPEMPSLVVVVASERVLVAKVW
jgi:hypothetical protein